MRPELNMRYISIFSSIFAGTVFINAQTLDSLIARVRSTYDRIETFYAEAYVYEYYG